MKYRLISVWVQCNEEFSQKRCGKFISIVQVYVFKIIEVFYIKEKRNLLVHNVGFIKIWHEINSSETHLWKVVIAYISKTSKTVLLLDYFNAAWKNYTLIKLYKFSNWCNSKERWEELLNLHRKKIIKLLKVNSHLLLINYFKEYDTKLFRKFDWKLNFIVKVETNKFVMDRLSRLKILPTKKRKKDIVLLEYKLFALLNKPDINNNLIINKLKSKRKIG